MEYFHVSRDSGVKKPLKKVIKEEKKHNKVRDEGKARVPKHKTLRDKRHPDRKHRKRDDVKGGG